MDIIIIRHADPDYENSTITEKGHTQAQYLSERIVKLDLDDVYVSPFGRAQDTAKYYLRKTGKKPEILPWLRELQIKGCPWGSSHNNYLKSGNYGTVKKWENEYFAGPETKEVFDEVASGLDDLISKYGYKRKDNLYHINESSNKKIGLFCHAATTMAVLSHLLNWILPMCFAHFEVPVTGITWINFAEENDEAIPKLRLFGDICHLEDDSVFNNKAY